MHICITIHFYRQLNDFLPAKQQNTDIPYSLETHRSVKDLIESFGIPHTEVDLIIVNGISVDMNYHPRDNDHIRVYPVACREEARAITATLHPCQPPPLDEARFVLDVHLGRLAAYLRMTGFDSLYRNDYDDPELADISAREQRILLSCDRKLLMRRHIDHAYFVRNRQPQRQLREVLARYHLYDKIKPFSRCMHCNGLTVPVDKQQVENRLQEKTRRYYQVFHQCRDCGRLYWQGSHYQRMQQMIQALRYEQTLDSAPVRQ